MPTSAPVTVQDLVAITLAVAAAAWLVRTLLSRLLAPPCGPPPGIPPGHDGFVPLEGLTGPRPRQESAPPGTPGAPCSTRSPGRPSLPG